jgi:hypothetical protein
MKQPKKPTYDQKRVMSRHGLDPRSWAVVSDSKAELKVISKRYGVIKILPR